jgi:hypothetical protein
MHNNEQREMSHAEEFFRSRERSLLRRLRQQLDDAMFAHEEAERIVKAVERELEAMRAEVPLEPLDTEDARKLVEKLAQGLDEDEDTNW